MEDIARDFGIPPEQVPNIDPSSPLPLRMMGATGTLPVPPKVLMAVQYVLMGDPDDKVAAAAKISLKGLPANLVVANIDPETHPKLLEFLAYERTEQDVLETVVLRRQTNDETICYLAETGDAVLLEIIAGNQERTLVTPEILLHLKANPECPVNLIDKVASWQRMNHVELELEELVEIPVQEPEPEPKPRPAPASDPGLDEPLPGEEPYESLPGPAPEFYDDWAHAEDADGPATQFQADDPFLSLLQDMGIELKPEFFDEGPTMVDPQDAAEQAERDARMLMRDHLDAEDVDEEGDSDGMGSELMTSMASNNFNFSLGNASGGDDWDIDLLMDHGDRVDDDVKESIGKKVGKLAVGEKIKLAYLGNKEVREVLIKDTNKMVCAAVVKSGRLTDPEVNKAAGNRAISEEVLRIIGTNREWTRKYPIKVNLVNNPKTPVGVAMSFLSSLLPKDLRNLSNNKNVSSVIAQAASVRLKARTER